MAGFMNRFLEWVTAPALTRMQASYEAVIIRLEEFSTQAKFYQTQNELRAQRLEQQLIQHEAKLHQSFLLPQSAIEQQFFDVASAKVNSLFIAGLHARSARLRSELEIKVPIFKPSKQLPIEESLRRLEALNPALYPVWRELFENGAKGYVEERLGSCSHREQKYAQLFGCYLEIYAHGRILDIGCGPYGLPSYLATRNACMVCGLEPLPMLETAAFEVVRGINEFLPWDDAQFDTVVSGTSLDHVMSLDTSLREVNRVLKPGGKYIVWLASISGAAPFNEKSQEFKAIDRFHLFHFDRIWIEPLFERYFDIEDVTIVPQPGFDHVFYCMTPRRS